MKKTALMLTIILMLASLVWGQSNLNEMRLKRIHGETVLRIDASGPFQYSHQIEEAKDGKPFRIIVDIFPALHNFGQKIFGKLPGSIVTSLRTSQYAAKPEKIVRVVLDLQKAASYRIEKSGNYIFVYIPDSQAADFPEWTSATAKSAVTDKPALAAVPPKPESRPAAKSVTAEGKPPVVAAKTETRSPVVAVTNTDVKSPAVPDKSETKTEPVTVAVKSSQETKTVAAPTDVATITGEAKTENPSVQVSANVRGKQSRFVDAEIAQGDKKPSAAPAVTVPVSKPNNTEVAVESSKPAENQPNISPTTAVVTTSTQKPAVQPRSANPPGVTVATKSAPTSGKPGNAPDDKIQPDDIYFDSNIVAGADSPDNLPAITTPVDSAALAAKPTSRFRRDPAFPNKLKGTIVAEFPQRMVIEYAPGDFRDPFETLIDDTRQSSGPRENRIPDVETSRLVGVLESNNGDNRALLEDMDGYGYIVKAGDKVKKGYVDKIDADKAFFQLFEYGWSRTIALFLGHN